MSMWEVEYLVEEVIKFIGRSDAIASEKRNLIGNAYHIQDQFDCSFTHFRVKALLLENEYIQPYAIKEFPLYNDYTEWFDKLINHDFVWIRQHPEQPWSEDNLEIGYWDKESQQLYVNFATPYYTLYPKETFIAYKPLDFSLKIIEEAGKQKNKDIVYDWTAFIIFYLLTALPADKTVSELKDAYFSKIKTIFAQFDFTDYEPVDDRLDLYSNFHEEWLPELQLELLKFVTN